MRPSQRRNPFRGRAILVGTIASAALAAVALSSCSSSAAGGSGSTSPANGNSTASAAGAQTRNITDAKSRTVTVPSDAQRVLALSEPTLDGALALGVNVVGTTSGRGQAGVSAYLATKAKGIPIAATVAGPNLEKIATLDPDLILVDGTVKVDDATFGKLTDLAPTVYVSKTGENWRTAFEAEASILGQQPAGAKVLAAYDAKVKTVKAALGANSAATVSIVRWGSGEPSMMLKEIAASTVVAELGLRRPPSQNKTGDGHSTPVSLENLDQLDADWMFFGSIGGATSPDGGNSGTSAGVAASQSALTKAESTPGFTALRAHRLHHVVAVDGSAWMSAGGPLAEEVVLTGIADALS